MPGHAVPQVPQTGTPYAYPVEDNHRTAHAGRSLCHKHYEQEPLQKILSEFDLSKNELKVLLYALSHCQTDNVIETNSKLISKLIKVDSGNIRNAIKSLRQKEIIVKEEDGQTLLNLTKFMKKR